MLSSLSENSIVVPHSLRSVEISTKPSSFISDEQVLSKRVGFIRPPRTHSSTFNDIPDAEQVICARPGEGKQVKLSSIKLQQTGHKHPAGEHLWEQPPLLSEQFSSAKQNPAANRQIFILSL